MPPQLTNSTCKTEGDATMRGLGLSIVSMESAVDQALAARLEVSAPSLDDLPERDAAGPTVAWTRVLVLLGRYWHAFQVRRRRRSRSLHVSLQELSDSELRDIGLTRGEIDYLTPQRAIDTLRDHTTYLWSRLGM